MTVAKKLFIEKGEITVKMLVCGTTISDARLDNSK
jgi:hypothetical protein